MKNQNQDTDKNDAQKNKPMSDFMLGLILFIVFIIFMALWLHFQLPSTHKSAKANAVSSNHAAVRHMSETRRSGV